MDCKLYVTGTGNVKRSFGGWDDTMHMLAFLGLLIKLGGGMMITMAPQTLSNERKSFFMLGVMWIN